MRAVNWLINVNTDRRADKKIDKAFIKALLIAVLSVKAIKSCENFDEGSISFVKGRSTFLSKINYLIKVNNIIFVLQIYSLNASKISMMTEHALHLSTI